MDAITKSFVDELASILDIAKKKLDEQFEYFSNYCVISKEYGNTSFDVEDTLTGKATQGIDGIAIIVNNKIVNTVQEIEDLIALNKYLNVKFVFVQSKTSSSFNNMEILNFFEWTRAFFSTNPSIFSTEETKKFIELKKFIYDNSKLMKERNPICSMYFVCTGKWQNDASLVHVIESNKKLMDDTNLFETVEFAPCDAREIQKYYRKTQELITATINFEKKVTLPKIPHVKVAYFGMLPFAEYRKVIIDDEDNIRPVFDDNIRDFLGTDNDVNEAIQETIFKKKFDYFGILNNGVTVVADDIAGAGDTLTLTNYQIVNGCQTSHILYHNRTEEGIDSLNIPLRIVITTDDDVKNEITKATNSQTAVKKEELEALSEFQRNLEIFYQTIDKDDSGKLFYERRTNQYSTSAIQKTRIVTIANQIKFFTAMFLDNPHGVSGYYGTIAKSMGNKIFKPDHEYIPYYVSALASYRLETYFRTNKLPKEAKRMRYHVLMLMRILYGGTDMPEFNGKKMNQYCKQLVTLLNDQEKSLKAFENIIAIITSQDGKVELKDRKVFEKKETTDILLNEIDRIIKTEKERYNL